MTCYTIAEPTRTSAYFDQKGGLHETAEQARGANLHMDLMAAITKHCSAHSIPLDTRRIILGIARSNPDLLRAVASMSMGAGA